MRYAGYARISSDDQVGNYSLDAQQRAIARWVAARGGRLVDCYLDEAYSGRTLERPALMRLLRAARRGAFEALVVHRLDRIARGRVDALAVKTLLRVDCGVKVFSVTEATVDSDGEAGLLLEAILASRADWYSENLAAEVAKGKRERSRQGRHNNRAPFGMKKDKEGMLVADPRTLPGLLFAFDAYAVGTRSDNDVARMLNAAGYRSTTGRRFSKDTVRDILQNRTYLGETRYQKYVRRANGRRAVDVPVEWFPGAHAAVLSRDLFEVCQEVRARRRRHRQSSGAGYDYLLRDLVYCHACYRRVVQGARPRDFGKMRCQPQANGKYLYYRCRAVQLGYKCPQQAVRGDRIEKELYSRLSRASFLPGQRDVVARAAIDRIESRALTSRLDHIQRITREMDLGHELGFTDRNDYAKKYEEMRAVIEQSPWPETPAQDVLQAQVDNFAAEWLRSWGNDSAMRVLVKRYIRRVEVKGSRIVAVTLYGDVEI